MPKRPEKPARPSSPKRRPPPVKETARDEDRPPARARPAPRAMPMPMPMPERPLEPIRKIRSPHGTRVARRIVCSVCGKADIIDFAPKNLLSAMCKACALERVGVFDPDDKEMGKFSIICVTCGRGALLSFRPEDPSKAQCADCYRGIESRQEDRTRSGERVSNKVVRVRRR